jgi:chemotaxis protein CheC
MCPERLSTLHLLQQLFASATRDASAAMASWTNSPIALTLDEVCELPLRDTCLALHVRDERLAMVVLLLEGDLGGAMVLAFDEGDARRLAASLLQCEPGVGPAWSDMELSALAETGNILSCAYVNAITRLIDQPLVPSVPHFVQDYAASVFQQVLTAQASGRDSVLSCHTGFRCANDNLSWRVLFVPGIGLRSAVEDALQSHS